MKKITFLIMLLIGFSACKKTETEPDYTVNYIGTFSQNIVNYVSVDSNSKISYKFIFTKKDNNTLLSTFFLSYTGRIKGILYDSRNSINLTNIKVTQTQLKINESVIVNISNSKFTNLVTGTGTLTGNTIALDLTIEDPGIAKETQKLTLIKE